MCALLSLWKKGKGRAGHGQITSTSLSAPASAPGELGMHRRNQKTWVPVPALPLTTYVTLGKLPDISKFQFHYSMLWGLTMIYINVICSLPTSIQFLLLWAWLRPYSSEVSCSDLCLLEAVQTTSLLLLLTVRSLYRNHCSCPLHASQSVKLSGLIFTLDRGTLLSLLTLLSPPFNHLRTACLRTSKNKSSAWKFRQRWREGSR